MLRLRSFVSALVIAAVVILSPNRLVAQNKVDVTGKWLFTVTTGSGNGTPTVTLKQQGDSVTGHYSSQVLGEADLKGTVKDRTIRFAFTVEVQGTRLPVTYTGTMETDGTLKGSVDLGGQSAGTFTGKRQ